MKITDKVKELIALTLREDIGNGDHSSLSCIPAEAQGDMKLLIKQDGVLAGVDVAREVLRQVDENIRMEVKLNDGTQVKKGDIAFTLHGSSRNMLTAERTLLNFMQRMSGIATTTREYVDLVKDTNVILLDTRKTTPNMRIFEKYAVTVGGAQNHRFGLYDMMMLKITAMTVSIKPKHSIRRRIATKMALFPFNQTTMFFPLSRIFISIQILVVSHLFYHKIH